MYSETHFLFQAGNIKSIYKTGIRKAIVKSTLFLLFQTFVCNFCFSRVYSQLSPSDTITIHSKIFDAARKVIITKTSKIKINDTSNNCIIYMDADDRNINGTFLQSANNLMANKEIPPSYLVGIIHENRNTELLEKDKLLSFLKEELLPYLKENCSIGTPLTIAGHSFGGYFATYAFLKDNATYNACIAISPAYWPNKYDIINLSNKKQHAISGNFYLAVGDKRWDEISLREGIFKVKNILLKQKNIAFNFNDLRGFSHNATPTAGMALGLSSIYDKWEWANILEEQENRLKLFPGFWGHLEIKADALFHLNRMAQAKSFYQEALKNIPQDEKLSKPEIKEITKRLRTKIKHCRAK